MHIIHISGTSGSGKTTLGNYLQKKLKNAKVYDTDNFIQHDTKEGKLLNKIAKTENKKEYIKIWKKIIRDKIDRIIEDNLNKCSVIIFVGLLNNWAWNNTPYNLHIQCEKYFLDVSLPEIIKRYYLRIFKTEQEVSVKQSKWYWNCIADARCNIRGSDQIIKNYGFDVEWHTKHGYKVMSDKKIFDSLSKII
jgi:adenylate kinase family enzyme